MDFGLRIWGGIAPQSSLSYYLKRNGLLQEKVLLVVQAPSRCLVLPHLYMSEIIY